MSVVKPGCVAAILPNADHRSSFKSANWTDRQITVDQPNNSHGALFELIRDGRGVLGGWRDRPDSGGALLAAGTTMMALPIKMAMLPSRMADIGLAMIAPVLEALTPPPARFRGSHRDKFASR